MKFIFHKKVTAALVLLVAVFVSGCGSNSEGITTTQMGGAKQGNNLVIFGIVSTLAGVPFQIGIIDGIAFNAGFSNPSGITTDGTYLYVADTGNNRIRIINIATRNVATLAGTFGTGTAQTSGSTDGIGTAAKFNAPWDLTTDGTNLYVADMGNNTIRKIVIANGAVTTLAGRAGTPGSVDGVGASALFNAPSGITTDGTYLYVSDTGNYTIRKVEIATGAVTTVAGNTGTSGSTDGVGSAAFFSPVFGITTDGTNLFVADNYNETIRKVVIATGAVTTIAGSAGIIGKTDGIGSAAKFNSPVGVTCDGSLLYVTDTRNGSIRKIDLATGTVTTLVGNNRFTHPLGLTTDGGSLYVADAGTSTIELVK